MDRSESIQGWWLHPAALTALFVLGVAAFLPDHLLFHPDERHYVDAGLEMVATGDWLTPRTAEGELRLRKPILPYWFVAAGCAVFGPSPFSTRLLFALAGGGIVGLSWLAARQATGSARSATLTALIVMCHPALLLSATRSLPDVVLSLFLTMSLAGFLGIIGRARAGGGSLVLAYGGGALAILSKGAPAAVFVLYATLFLVVRQRPLLVSQWRRFTLAGVSSLVLAGSWFLAMELIHGNALGDQFVDDQAGSSRFAGEALQIPLQAASLIGLLLASFGAALLPSVQTLWQRRRDLLPILDRPANHFLLSWCLLFIAAASCVNHVSLRYLLPLVAPLAVIAGAVLTELDGPILRRNLRWTAWLSVGLLLPVAGFAGLLMTGGEPLLRTICLIAVVTAGFFLWGQLKFTASLRSVAVAAVATHVALFALAIGGLGLTGRSFGYEMAEVLKTSEVADGAPQLVLVGEAAHASRVRVCSGGEITVHWAGQKATPVPVIDQPVAALDASLLPPVSDAVEHVHIPCGFDEIEPGEVWKAVVAGNLPELLRQRQREYTVAIPTRMVAGSTRRGERQSQTAQRDGRETETR